MHEVWKVLWKKAFQVPPNMTNRGDIAFLRFWYAMGVAIMLLGLCVIGASIIGCILGHTGILLSITAGIFLLAVGYGFHRLCYWMFYWESKIFP